MTPAISIEKVSKAYQLGVISAAELKEDFARWWATLRGKADPLSKIGEELAGDRLGEYFWALRDVTCEIEEGEVLGIVGRNGAGKSTLLKILSQITAPTSGEIKIRGRLASLLEVGTGFHSDLTGSENIFLNGAILGMTKREIRRKHDEIVAFSGIEEFIDTPVKRYSSGMYVRLAFAVAAHLDPEVLVIDEVLAVGDADFQQKCLGRMEDVHRSGRTVIFVSHNMASVAQLCTKVLFLDEGRVAAIGPTNEVIAKYSAELAANASGDLASLRLKGLSRKAWFDQIKLCSDAGGQIRFGEPLEIELAVSSGDYLSGLSLRFSVYGAGGHCIGSLITRDTFSVAPKEATHLRLTIPDLPLAPGHYHSGISVGEGYDPRSRTDHDAIVGRPSFQVIASEKGQLDEWPSSWGTVVLPGARLEECSSSVTRVLTPQL